MLFDHASIATVGVEEPTVKFDLEMELIHCRGEATTSGDLNGTLIYDSALYDVTTVERWVGYFVRLIQNAARSAHSPLRLLSMYDATERDRILTEFNSTRSIYPRDQCIHNMVETQANLTPDAVALEWRGAQDGLQDDPTDAMNARRSRELVVCIT